MTAPRPFDLLAVPLEGLQVIEASAGTGKTHTITGLFLRLVVEAGVPVDRILVVTYTVAATEELRERIRAVLAAALAILRGGTVPGDMDGALVAMAAALVGRVADRTEAARRIEHALRNFDQAGIDTIHGFCRRALVESAFDTGAPFACELVPDVRELLQEVVDDFWRTRVVDASSLFLQHLLDRRVTPESLAAAIARHLGRPDLEIVRPEPAPDAGAMEEECLGAWDRLRALWPGARAGLEQLLLDPGLNKQRYNPASVPTWLRRMDGYVRAELPGLRPFEQLEKFRASTVAGSWKKAAAPRTHPALDAVETFAAALERVAQSVRSRLAQLEVDLLLHARAELGRRQRRQRVQSFDDLLLALGHALEAPSGAALAARLRTSWAAALIDEFQDTDPTQYRIVQRIWGGSAQPVFVVGDPKQAIYRFRGADIYAYLAARGDAGARHDLVLNWRSDAGLIAAVNAIFSRARRPFVLEAIPFLPARPARSEESLVLEGEPPEPFRVWFLEREDDRRLLSKRVAASRAAGATAAEIARLLRLADQGRARLRDRRGGERPLAGGDIAVLVRSHRQGRRVAAALAALNVPSVQQAEDSVFGSREAEELRRVLLAVAEPARDDIVRAALGTEMLGATGEELAALLDDGEAWTRRVEAFHGYHQRWRAHGFARMVRSLLADEDVPRRLLAYADGERRLTNLLHLGELLQDEAARHPRGLETLAHWMAARAADPRPESEEQQLRLESDEHVVKIVTIHKSKGLQYPVVFCPFVWDGRLFAEREERDVVCHDPSSGDRATLEMEADARSPLRLQACREELAESLRLFYVALTRAIHRCTIVWGATNDSPTSAPFWLLHAPDGADTVEALRASRKDDAALRRDLEELRARSGGTIALAPLPDGPGVPYRAPADAAAPLAARRLVRSPARTWRVASFTALAAERAGEGPDHDAGRDRTPADGATGRTMLTFPTGASAGSCLHAVLERLDFTDADGARRREVVARELRRFGFAAEWVPAVEGMVERVLETPLDGAGRIRLARVPRERRQAELEFTYPLADFAADGLRAVLRADGFASGSFADAVDGLSFARVTGFMRGFIDLVFEAEGRYWLVDYKSNWLGPALEDYRAERLPAVMARESYWLQYLIYTVVLHRLLALRLPGYDYDAHVGGVFYLFLRGMDPALGPASGVFHDRPSRALVLALDRWIGSGMVAATPATGSG